MNRTQSHADTERQRRQDFEDALTALELPEHHKLALRAAGSSWAKAAAVYATASYIDSRTLRSRSPELN